MKANCVNPILIGGCGSSGTTLVKTLLNTHSKIVCGPEMSVFDRPVIYDISMTDLYNRWQSKAFDYFDQGCVFPLRIDGKGSYFAFSRDEYHNDLFTDFLFETVTEVREFWSSYFSEYAKKKGKEIWAEKTPNNVYCIGKFLDWFPQGRFINVLRDGRDVIASLVETRGFDPFRAIFRWITSVAAYQEYEYFPRVYCVRYENLVQKPEATMAALIGWLGLEWEHNIYTENEVHTKSVGRWRNLSDNINQMIRLACRNQLLGLGYDDGKD